MGWHVESRGTRPFYARAVVAAPAFLDRTSECEVLDRLLDRVRGGESAALVVRGEAGIGKSALLAYAMQRASGFRVAEIGGVESEMELAFAGVHQLCAPMLGRIDVLPSPQRDAVSVAFGLSSGAPPEHFILGLAILGLLSEVAAEQPLLCLVDDAQWLDSATKRLLGFIARRLVAESIALVFAVRARTDVPELAGLPELDVRGLSDADSRALLEATISGGLDDRIRMRIISETRGNPLALLELPHGRSAAQLAGGFALPAQGDVTGAIEAQFRQRIASLPEATRRFMLLASADPIGDFAVLARAAQELGLEARSAQPAQDAQLLELWPSVRFRHPLLRSAAYWSASAEDRQAVHRALASAINREADPERHCWHRANATTPPDEEIAGELTGCGVNVQMRGGVAAAAAFFERAVLFSADNKMRSQRALTAANAKLAAGDLAGAESLLLKAEVSLLDESTRAQVAHTRARIAFDRERGRDAPVLLLRAARELEAFDIPMARRAYLEAVLAAVYAADLASSTGIREVASAARSAPLERDSSPLEGLLAGLAVRLTDGYVAAAPTLKESLTSFLDGERLLDWSYVAYDLVAMELWNDEAWFELASGQIKLARATGALVFLPYGLEYLASFYVQAGDLSRAAELAAEAERLTPGVRQQTLPYIPLRIAAWRGQTPTAEHLVEKMLEGARTRGEGCAISSAHHAQSVLYNGLGRFELALRAAQKATLSDELVTASWGLYELVEAASGSGNDDIAKQAAHELSERAGASGTPWAAGTAALSQALIEGGQQTERFYLEAIDALERCRMAAHLARAHLNYGTWLCSEGRRAHARDELSVALDTFTAMGAAGFAERARDELRAAGGEPPTRRSETPGRLTPQEQQIAQLASEGRTNSEIGAELYLSGRTIEWHLRKVFSKLGIRSRRQLEHVLQIRERGDGPG